MHAGEGRIAQLPDLPPLPASEIDDNELRQVRSHRDRTLFVPPEGYEAARSLLAPSMPVLVVIGHTGSGKRTMALRLLWERSAEQWGAGPGELTIRELLPDWEEPNAQRLPVEGRHGYLLDLGRDDPKQHPVWPFAKALREHASRLAAADSYLVITTTEDRWRDCNGVLDRFCVRLARPAPARSIVEWRIPGPRRAWLQSPVLDGLFAEELSPAAAVRLADAITRAAGEEGPAVEPAVDEFRRWRRMLAGWCSEHSRPADWALLTAAAVFDGSPVDEVWGAASALQRLLEGGARPGVLLAGPGRTTRLDLLPWPRPGQASPGGSRPDFHDAVVDFVVDEYPAVIRVLWNWLDDPATLATYVPHRVARVARVLAGRSIRRGRPVFLDRLPRLVDAGGGQRVLARLLLEQTVLDPVVGGQVRRRIRLWAEHDSTSAPLAATIAAVCGGAFGQRLPTVALATLRRLLGRPDRTGDELAALAALARLAGRDDHRRFVLNTVVRWMTQHHQRYAGGLAFLRLMRPGPGSVAAHLVNRDAADPQVFRLLRIGWQRLGDTGVSTEQTTGLIQAWVAAVRRGELRRDLAADLLVLAIEEDLGRMATARDSLKTERLDLLRGVLGLRNQSIQGWYPSRSASASGRGATGGRGIGK